MSNNKDVELFVYTDAAFPVSAREIESEQADGEQGKRIEFFVGDRRLGEVKSGPDSMEKLRRTGMFDAPRIVGMIARKEEKGVHGTVVLMMPGKVVEEPIPVEREPWAESLPQYEAEVPKRKRQRNRLLVIGAVMRPLNQCEHGSDLVREAADMLAALIHEGRAITAEEQAIDDLLNNLDD